MPPPGEFQIDIVEGEILPSEFKQNYYDPQRPLIVRGTEFPVESPLTTERVRDACDGDPECATAGRWVTKYEFPHDHAAASRLGLSPPALYRHCCPPSSVISSRCRIWLNDSREARTAPWHYDRGGIDAFCYMLLGRKRWTLVSPDTPLPMCAFMEMCLYDVEEVARGPLRRTPHATVETRAGDMLYIPRHWLHTVQHIGPEPTLQFDFVSSRRVSAVTTVISRREHALEPVRSVFHSLTPAPGYRTATIRKTRTFDAPPRFAAVLRQLSRELILMLVRFPAHVRQWRRLLTATSAEGAGY